MHTQHEALRCTLPLQASKGTRQDNHLGHSTDAKLHVIARDCSEKFKPGAKSSRNQIHLTFSILIYRDALITMKVFIILKHTKRHPESTAFWQFAIA